ncbi:MAG: hypothetical protein LBD18_02340 [Treponema sp.]|jgi:hypothetical protein|nr:hypothetical protein [Treponema sp.]
MNTRTKKVYKLITVFAALVLCVIGCNNILQPKAGGAAPNIDQGKGLVQINIGTVAGRTLLPAQADLLIDEWTLTFTPAAGNPLTTQTIIRPSLSQPVQIEKGEWALSLEAKKDGTVIASGTASGTITVTSGQAASATVSLVFASPASGSGSLNWNITDSSSLTTGDVKIELLPLNGGTVQEIGTALTGNKNNIAAGYYLITVILTRDGKKALKSDVAHIYKDQTTKLAWTFVAADFHAAEKIWLVGGMNSWTLPGTLMTDLNHDGSFEWEGDVTGTGDSLCFRFSLLDTSGWFDTDNGHSGDNKWWGHWFAPQNPGNTTAALNTGIPLTYYHYTNPDTAKWEISPGWYKISLDPLAKTFKAEKPVIVESVTVNGDSTITAGQNKTYTAVVGGKNTDSAQGVTWSITSSSPGGTVAAGTSINASTGVLTIAQLETETGVTIRGTSTHTGSKYGEKSITIAPLTTGNANITWNLAADQGGSLSLTGSAPFTVYKTSGTNSATVSVIAVGYSFEWYVDGVSKGTNDSITIDSNDYALGGHELLLIATNGSVPWTAPPVKFTVAK